MAPLTLGGAWAYGLLLAVAAAAAVTDVRSGKIYNVITYPAIAAGLIVHTALGGLAGDAAHLGLAGSLAGLAAGFLPMLAACLAGGVGMGDAKLMAAVGALTGWRFALAAMFYGLIVAALLAIVVMIARRATRQTLGRIWRLLLAVVMPRGAWTQAGGAPSAKVPIGLALSIGVVAALAELWWRGSGWIP